MANDPVIKAFGNLKMALKQHFNVSGDQEMSMLKALNDILNNKSIPKKVTFDAAAEKVLQKY